MTRSTLKLALLGAAVSLALAMPAAASQVFSTGYDGPNGGGQGGDGGSHNYWDGSYTGSGSETVNGAPLSGGHGDLTDGYIESQTWNNVENDAGTGPYVGWFASGAGGENNPLLTFHFAGGTKINSINIYLDNSGIGGVFAPGAIKVDGNSQSFSPPSGVGVVTLGGLNLTGPSHTVQFFQSGNTWTFVSEITFEGAAVPEPASWALMIGGFGLAGAALRRRRLAAA